MGLIFLFKWLKWLWIYWWICFDVKCGDRWRFNRVRINLFIIRYCFWLYGYFFWFVILCCFLMILLMLLFVEYLFVNCDRFIVVFLCFSWIFLFGDVVFVLFIFFVVFGIVEWWFFLCFLYFLFWVFLYFMCLDVVFICNLFCFLFFFCCIVCYVKVCVCVCVLVLWIVFWLFFRVRFFVVDVVNVV